jgi:V/A-type H+-transporting ATPase subunit D
MARLHRVPPGRAGRIWLQHRLAVAGRGAELLDQKLRILHSERQRLTLAVDRTRGEWEAAHREAETWLARAVLLAGVRSIRLAAPDGAAQVDLTWAHKMGTSFPADATLSFPRAVPEPPLLSAAVLATRPAFEHAVDAAVEHALAQAAFRTVDEEMARTRHRLRALTNTWIPQLTSALTETLLALEEEERTETLRLRWVRAANSETRLRAPEADEPLSGRSRRRGPG